MRYAQVDGAGRAVAFLDGHPDDWPDLRDAGVLRVAGPTVEQGWVWDGTQFAAPPTVRHPVTPLVLRRRFTAQERAAITLAASQGLEAGDATLQVWLDDLNSATEVDLSSPDLREGLQFLVLHGIGGITQGRIDAILAG